MPIQTRSGSEFGSIKLCDMADNRENTLRLLSLEIDNPFINNLMALLFYLKIRET